MTSPKEIVVPRASADASSPTVQSGETESVTYFWAPARGFFVSTINEGQIPVEAIVIAESRWRELLAGQAIGKVIVAGEDGDPVLVDPEPMSVSELAVMASSERDHLLAAASIRVTPLQDAVDTSDATDEEQASLYAWKRYRVALNRIESQPGFPNLIDWPVAPN